MYANRFISLRHLLPASYFQFIIHLFPIALAYALYVWLGYKNATIPLMPISIIGTAVAFYVGFKNNSSYDRMWEGRRIWGSITNASRSWATMVLALTNNHNSEDVKLLARHMVLRHIGWCNVLRLQLRRNKVWKEKYYQNYISNVQRKWNHDYAEVLNDTLDKFCGTGERTEVIAKQNAAAQLLHLQSMDIKYLKEQGVIDQWEHANLTNIITDLYNQQGGCERIKGYPFPRQYAVFSRLFVDIFLFLLPFGLISEITRLTPDAQWLLFPVCIVVNWVFNAMEAVGDLSENPFENALTDVPMSAICRNIEIDLREMMNDKDIPERLNPVEGVLM
ncbi:MAG: bestrophin family ion channel [Bacteroidota bacterium]